MRFWCSVEGKFKTTLGPNNDDGNNDMQIHVSDPSQQKTFSNSKLLWHSDALQLSVNSELAVRCRLVIIKLRLVFETDIWIQALGLKFSTPITRSIRRFAEDSKRVPFKDLQRLGEVTWFGVPRRSYLVRGRRCLPLPQITRQTEPGVVSTQRDRQGCHFAKGTAVCQQPLHSSAGGSKRR